ncbi:MAG: hypothetical protein OCD02_23505 [Spirochaetaceae bacterium]
MRKRFFIRINLKFVYVLLLLISIANLLAVVYSFSSLSNSQKVHFQRLDDNEIKISDFQKLVKDYSNIIDNSNEKKYIIIEKKEVNNILELLVFLKNDFENSKKDVISETSFFIDKVNLYLSIGIVLLTLMGVFIPVIVQSFSQQDIKDKQKQLSKNQNFLSLVQTKLSNDFTEKNKIVKTLGSEIKNIENELRIEKAEIDKNKDIIKTLHSDSKKIFPIRLVFLLDKTLDKDLIKQFTISPQNYIKSISITINEIKNELENCCENDIFPDNDNFLKGGLRKFVNDFDLILLSLHDRRALKIYEKIIIEIKRFVELENYTTESYIPLIDVFSSVSIDIVNV